MGRQIGGRTEAGKGTGRQVGRQAGRQTGAGVLVAIEQPARQPARQPDTGRQVACSSSLWTIYSAHISLECDAPPAVALPNNWP